MRKRDVVVGDEYAAKVSGKYVRIVILREGKDGGWIALNRATGREVKIKTAGRLTPLRVPY
jgi:hypothetical protein